MLHQFIFTNNQSMNTSKFGKVVVYKAEHYIYSIFQIQLQMTKNNSSKLKLNFEKMLSGGRCGCGLICTLSSQVTVKNRVRFPSYETF